MDFPVFHLDFMGNRMLMAVIAILHVLVNHAIAVGFIPLVTLLEYRGFRCRVLNKASFKERDDFAYKLMFVAFVITTSIGALTGVGIWFAASLANPNSIGSLIRVFYGAWFTEWIVFVLEVVFVMIYFLTWKKSNESIQAKKRHLLFGGFLSIFSWFTMAIIVGILGFMMDPGSWLAKESMITGFTNPVYLPQLMFRTPLAMVMGGTFALFLSYFFLKKKTDTAKRIIRLISFWILVWTPYTLIGAYVYYHQVPEFMIGNMPVALTTQDFEQWYDLLLNVIIISVIIALIIGISGTVFPKKIPRWSMIIPLFILFFFLGTFERMREFIRKPYVIGKYMYANSLIEDDYPLYKRDGILKHATYVSTQEITEENKVEAGKDVFIIACTRCHTTHGINSVVTRFEKLYGEDQPFNIDAMKGFMKSMHNVRMFMPPFPGNDEELDALAHYIKDIRQFPDAIEGAQVTGTPVISVDKSKLNSSQE
jgi:cytochrome c553